MLLDGDAQQENLEFILLVGGDGAEKELLQKENKVALLIKFSTSSRSLWLLATEEHPRVLRLMCIVCSLLGRETGLISYCQPRTEGGVKGGCQQGSDPSPLKPRFGPLAIQFSSQHQPNRLTSSEVCVG